MFVLPACVPEKSKEPEIISGLKKPSLREAAFFCTFVSRSCPECYPAAGGTFRTAGASALRCSPCGQWPELTFGILRTYLRSMPLRPGAIAVDRKQPGFYNKCVCGFDFVCRKERQYCMEYWLRCGAGRAEVAIYERTYLKSDWSGHH